MPYEEGEISKDAAKQFGQIIHMTRSWIHVISFTILELGIASGEIMTLLYLVPHWMPEKIDEIGEERARLLPSSF